MFSDIQSGEPDTAACVMNQDSFILLQPAHRDYQRPGRQIIRRNRGALFKAELLGLFKSLRRRNGNQLCLSFELRHGNDGFADETLIDCDTYGFDSSRDFVTHDARLWWPVGIQALARENVGKIQACGFDADQDLVLSDRKSTRLNSSHS